MPSDRYVVGVGEDITGLDYNNIHWMGSMDWPTAKAKQAWIAEDWDDDDLPKIYRLVEVKEGDNG